jgi:hypothetical protein
MEWQPLAQAVFVAKLIDEDGYSFETVAEVVGKPKSDIAGMYRNQAIAKQATDHAPQHITEVKRTFITSDIFNSSGLSITTSLPLPKL